jgi:hypothetical protein
MARQRSRPFAGCDRPQSCSLHEVDSGDSVWVIGAKTGEAGGTARAIRTAER